MRVTSERAQLTLRDELIVDNFAGGGGASTGIELAAGRPVDIAANHDPAAILVHKTNHPFTERYCESVWDVDPVKVCRGRPVGLAWFSPDCKRFSKAKGAALVDRNRPPPRDYSGERGGVPDVGACPKREARQESGWPDFPEVAGTATEPWLRCRA